MRLTLGMFVVICSTAVAAPTPRMTPRRTVPITRQLKTKDKATSASYHDRKTPMPLRSGF